VAAPPEAVFAALVDPDALVVWLPPNGRRARYDHADLRPGGSDRLVLTYPEAGPGKTTAATDVVEARMAALVPGEQLVHEVDLVADDPSCAGGGPPPTRGFCCLRRLAAMSRGVGCRSVTPNLGPWGHAGPVAGRVPQQVRRPA